jgi:UDP-GlcNAc:undecaprenyl-phosphate GlcNAc-1-phosphate transferase
MSVPFTTSILVSMMFALLATLLMAWIGIKIARRFRLMDIPGAAPHKHHAIPTPLAGGIAVFGALIILATGYQLFVQQEIRAILLSGLVIFIMGVWDDVKGISPLAKLVGQGVAVILLIYFGVYIRIFESPEFFINGQGGIYLVLDWILTAFWIIGITNAFNFVDSMDGLAAALAGIAAAFFMLVTLNSNQPDVSRQSAILLGICIGLYFFNAPPARLFLGDSGAQLLGFVLAALAIIYTPEDTFQTSSWFVPILILGVPIFDMTLVVFSRLRHRRPIYKSALDHTYHRLVALGIESNRSVMAMHITSLSLGCLAFIALSLPPLYANAILGIVLFLGAVALLLLDLNTK